MELVLAGGIVAGAALFRGVTGFGFALIAAMGLTTILPPATAAPLILAMDIVLTALILRKFRLSDVDWRAAAVLLFFGLIGGIVGPLVASHLSDPMARTVTNAAVGVAALAALLKTPPRWIGSVWIGVGVAAGVGVLMAGFAVGGPLAAAWLLAGGADVGKVRSTLALYFGTIDAVGLIARYSYGMVPPSFTDLLLPLLVIAVIAYFPGEYLYRRMAPLVWRRVCAVSLVLIAVGGGAQSILAFYGADFSSLVQ